MTNFQKLLIIFLAGLFALLAVFGTFWQLQSAKQRSFNNCKWLTDQEIFDWSEEHRKENPEAEHSFQKCKSVFKNP